MKAGITIGLMAFVLTGCATRGAVTLDCPQFRSFAEDVPPTEIIRAIQSDAQIETEKMFSDEVIGNFLMTSGGRGLADRQNLLLQNLSTEAQNRTFSEHSSTTYQLPTNLLLSGGGQWGAFGAGYLEELSKQTPSALPQVQNITGVSTGALQSLYIGANQAQPNRGWLTKLRQHYSPESEKEIVDRGGLLSAVFNGSVAGLAPLRRKIEQALCSENDGNPLKCDLIEALALDTAPNIFIGFVEARSGKMQFIVANKIASADLPLREKQQCLAGAALASVAMPFHFQQVQIVSTAKGAPDGPLGAVTYYDGGVRQSVFFVFTDQLMMELVRRAKAAGGTGASDFLSNGNPRRAIYVLRNGPTMAPANEDVDTTAGGLEAALRGYQLIVNQSEITSIAAMRPVFPHSDIFVATADGHDRTAGFEDPRPEPGGTGALHQVLRCQKGTGKRGDMMFDPDFMACLRAFGRFKANLKDADRKNGWISIPVPTP